MTVTQQLLGHTLVCSQTQKHKPKLFLSVSESSPLWGWFHPDRYEPRGKGGPSTPLKRTADHIADDKLNILELTS